MGIEFMVVGNISGQIMKRQILKYASIFLAAMEPANIKSILNAVKDNNLSIEQALQKLRHLPFEDIVFAKIDHHRALRKGFPEVIFCQGKTKEQIKEIYLRLADKNNAILLTRADEDVFSYLKKSDSRLKYSKPARIIFLEIKKPKLAGHSCDVRRHG